MSVPERGAKSDAGLLRTQHEALTATREELFRLLDHPALEVIRSLLKNPLLDEPHLLVLLRRRDLPEDVVAAIGRHPMTEGSHSLQLALARHPFTPAHLVLSMLPQLYLFELVALCFLPGVTPDRKVAAERSIIQRLPVTPLGSRIALARRAPSAVLEALLNDPAPQLMEACLASPRLKESSLFRFVNGSGATAETISALARHPRWKSRPELKLAILKNSKTPLVWFTLFLPTLNMTELRNLSLSSRLGHAQKGCVKEELRRRSRG
jgi:hypothetical protein